MRAYRVVNCAVLCVGVWLGGCGGGGDDDSNPGDGTGGTGVPGGGTGGTGQMIGGSGGSNVTGGTGGMSGGGMNPGTGGTSGGGMNPGTGGTSGGGTGGMGGMMSGTGGSSGSTGGDASVLQYHKNATRDGMYVDAAFTRAAAAGLKVDSSFNATVAGPTYAQPLFFDGGGGGKDLVIVATEQNQVSAFNADDGSTVWQKNFGDPVSVGLPCGNINPLGITGTPVIDPKTKTLYFDAMTDSNGPKHLIHAVSLADGSEVTGWPLDVDMVKAGSLGFDSSVQNERGALIIVKDMLYVPYGGHYGDCGDYHGWVVGVSLSDPTKVVTWATRAHAGGVWAPGGIASDGTSLFVATGNTMADSPLGLFSAPDTYGDGESVIKLPGDLKYTMADSDFAAAMNWSVLDSGDSDIGGSGPVLFDVPGATPSKLAIALGKDGSAYLLDPSNLGGTGHWLTSKKVSGDQIIQAAVAYTTSTGTFVTMRASGQGCPSGSGQLTALSISAASPPAISVAWCAGDSGSGSPIVTSTDGTAESVVWFLTAERGNALVGYNGETGEQVFDGGGASLGSISRFQTPIAAKGRIFVASDSKVTAFKP